MLSKPSKDHFRNSARECGFALSGVAEARPSADLPFYRQWVTDGLAGPLGYLTDHRAAAREDPRHLLASARSLLCVAKIYKTSDISVANAGPEGFVSRYAWGAEDYHDVLRRDLAVLVQRLLDAWGSFEHRICVDTAPLLERSYARQAGLGWIGKNTCLINEARGSWFFLGTVLTSLEFVPDGPPPDRCGTCRRCIDACPTQALIPRPGGAGPAAWQMDASLCISTLTIEQRGPAPENTRQATGQHLFGCDICQEFCPWNRRSPVSEEPGFAPRHAILDLEEMAGLSAVDFRERFRSTPIWRTKYSGWLRNVATAMGNSGDSRHIPSLERLAGHEDAAVAEHARWALKRLKAGE